MVGQNVGYTRVSCEKQKSIRQLEDVQLDKVFSEVFTGKVKVREQLDACLAYLREGDTLHLHSIDRLARNLRSLQEIVDMLVAKGVTVKFHSENLTFGLNECPFSKLMLHMMGAFAEFERNMMRTRQREGYEAARKIGNPFGRKKLDMGLSDQVVKMKIKGVPITSIAQAMGISRISVYKLLKHAVSNGAHP